MPKPVKIGLGRTLARAATPPPISPYAYLIGIVFGFFLIFRK